MTFTRARHNPLSLVILNERRFCASEGPRRAARTGVPIMPAFGVMGWAMPRVLCEAILARLARFLMILVRGFESRRVHTVLIQGTVTEGNPGQELSS